MKKVIAVNGSPRKNGNTAEILAHALQGAAAAGAATEMIHLSDLEFTGCRSCFACKLKGSKCGGKCAIRDGLSPVIDRIFASDALIVGTPIYFGGESGLCRNFLERLLFPCLRYDQNYTSLAPAKVALAFIYTMNVDAARMTEMRYPEQLSPMQRFGGLMLSDAPVESLYVCDTFQFDDYSRYDAPLFDAEHKKSVREKAFSEDRRKAFALGQKLALRQ